MLKRSRTQDLSERSIHSAIRCRNHLRKATGHLIISPARFRTDSGIVRPICFAVLGFSGSRAGCFPTCNGLNLRTITLDSSPAWVANPSRAELPSANTCRFTPAHKENKHETGRTKKLASTQETKETPCYEEVHSGEEIKEGGNVKIED
jgi:hypothetical protein